MQQKSKFIIFISLICFIFLLFFSVKVWGSTNNPFPVGGTPSDCTADIKKCVDGYDEWKPASGTPGTDNYYPGGWDYICTEEEVIKEGDPSCSGSGSGTMDTKEEKDNWKCTCDGIQDTCHKSNTGSSSKAKCEECCPCGYYNICRKSNWAWLPWVDGSILYCKPAKWCEIKKEDECQTDAQCNEEALPPTTYNWKECVGSKCVSKSSQNEPIGIITCKDNTDCQIIVSPPPVSPPPVSPPPVSPPPVSPPAAPECEIYEFSINGKTNDDKDPLLVWVNASLRGRISTDADCTKCTVESDDTWGNPPKEYAINFANNYNVYETFEIPESGTYSFTVTCQGSDPDDIVVDSLSLETVEAINLPWWREIIPVLPGFLKGIFR